MSSDSRQVTIHLARVGKPERSYSEGFVEDDGFCLKTFSIAPEALGRKLSEKFQRQGWILPGQGIHAVAKFHFYNEFFNIVEYKDSCQNILGYYCDVVTPLQRKGDEYFLTDLILDIWSSPDRQLIELDRDELKAALSNGLIPPDVAERALAAVDRLESEVAAGIFPAHYLS